MTYDVRIICTETIEAEDNEELEDILNRKYDYMDDYKILYCDDYDDNEEIAREYYRDKL